MNTSQQLLLDRLMAFEIDEPGTDLTFARRLARENGWRPEYTERVILEYKRFLFLTMSAGHVVTPSEQVDQAWHMHLTYTRSYWNNLCDNVLGQPLHHSPTKGGATEQAKFIDLYNETLASYRRWFGEPPADVWPPAAVRFGEDLHHVSVNPRRFWIIPKPRLPRFWPASHGASLGVLGMGGLPLAAAWNPLDWRGPEFLFAYVAVAVIAAMGALVVRLLLTPTSDDLDSTVDPLDPYEVAVLAGGRERAVHAAVVAMVQAGMLQIVDEQTSMLGLFPRTTTTIRQGKPLSPEAPRMERAIYDAACLPAKTIAPLRLAGLPIAKDIEESLQQRGLLQAGPPAFHCLLAAAIMATPLLLGLVKIAVGVSRGRPVAFLVLLCAATAVTALVFLFARSRLSARGQAVLERVKAKCPSPNQLDQTAVAALAPVELATAVGLFGVGMLAVGPLAAVHAMLPRSCRGDATSTSYVGCGGGGCGGAGGGGCGGGGCGGGGCGGCGGS